MDTELELFDPADQTGRIVYEHLHRYALSREFVSGLRVLDLACGTGYGTAILGEVAAQATGLDISSAAIREARKRYGSDRVKYVIGDCFDLPFEADSFDVVVANEMIEHVEDHPALLAEVRRVLVDKGLFLVSTPNKPVYNRYKPPNTYHVAEMEIPEFRKLLTDRFKHVSMIGTRMGLFSVGYMIDRDETRKADNLDGARIYYASGDQAGQPEIGTGQLNLSDPEYVLAVCSDARPEDPGLSHSVFFDERNDLWLEYEKIMAWASGLHEEDEVLRESVRQANALLDEARARVSQLEAQHHGHEKIDAARRELVDALKREQEAVRSKADQHLATVSSLLGEMNASAVAADDVSIITGLFRANDSLTRERLMREQLDARINQALEDNAAFQNEIAQLKAERDSVRKELADRQWELGEERRKHAETEAAHTTVNLELERSTDRAAQLETKCERLDAEKVRIRAELASTEQSLSQIQAENTQLAARASTLESELEDASTSNRELNEELERVTLLAVSIEEELDASQQKAHDRIAELERQLEETDRELTEWLELEVSRAASLEDELEATRQSARKQVAELESRLKQANRQLADLRPNGNEPNANPAEQNGSEKKASQGSQPFAGRKAGKQDGARQTSAPEMVRAAIDHLHRRTAMTINEAHGRSAGHIAPAPSAKPLAWHRRLLGHQRPLETNIFSAEWIAQQRPELGDISLGYYLATPELHTLSPHPLFDAQDYLERYPDVAESGMSALAHYVLHGWREGRDPHALFANDWYLSENPDVASDGSMSALDHYLRFGWREGRRPNPLFDPRSYLDRYADVEAGEFEPLSHFIMHGQSEQRELAIRGLAKLSLPLDEEGGAIGLMRSLLREPAPRSSGDDETTASPTGRPIGSPIIWPPAPLDDFWPAQTMREYVTDKQDEALLARIWYLMSVMNRWRDRQDDFAASPDCDALAARLRERARTHARSESSEPAATIIIPVYNNLLDTILCLTSVLELEERHDFEVIVADDGSNDATSRIIPGIGGNVRYVRQAENLGFLGNCNAAAQQARGATLVLLNNDTLVFAGWLDGLLDPIETMEKVGLVGSKLLNWDGTLQEAGGIFWRDGSAWNFGRDQDAMAPQFNYLKDADYCSGASIAVPTRVWREVGGFDPAFTPAYCEDSDLAFRLRENGYRTLYNPASEVVHHEGRSHGRDVGTGIKAYQIANNERLFERWQGVLERDHHPNAQNVFRARDRSFGKKHVLIVDHYVPQWDKDAGSRTMFDFIAALIGAGHAVTFWPDNLWRDPDYTPRLQALGVEVMYGAQLRDGFDQFMTDRRDLYDMALLSRPHVAANYMDAVERISDARIVYYGHDLHFERMAAERALKGDPADDEEVQAMKAQELDICARSDLVLYPSVDEAAVVNELLGDKVEARAIAAYRYLNDEIADSRQALMNRGKGRTGLHLLFVGGFGHPPNGDAITWFCKNVMPLVKSRIPGARLSIVGSRPSPEILALAQPGVDVLGFVSDERLLELYREADIAVAPLRYGAGVKGKVIEAMARGLPVVTTDVGAQGLEKGSEFLFVGNDAEDLAGQVALAADHVSGQERALKALDFIEENYSTKAMIEILEMGLSRD